MRSVKSYFNKTLYFHDMKIGWPLYLVYFVYHFMTLIMPYLAEKRYDYGEITIYGYAKINQSILQNLSTIALPAIFFGVAIALLLFQYLNTARAANGLHALPLRREGHFLTHISAGLSYFTIPNVLISLLLVVVQLKYNALDLFIVFQWFAAATLICLFFFALGVFCAMFTGVTPMLPLFYLIWNFLFWFLYEISDYLLRILLYGYNGWNILSKIASTLTPFAILVRSFGLIYYDYDSLGNEVPQISVEGWGYVLLYAVVAVLLLAASLQLYRKRRLESAGDVVAVPWAKHLFRFGMAFCGGVGGGVLIYRIFVTAGQGRNVLLLGALIVLCAAAFYLVAEMFLEKSFRVLAHAWKGVVGLSIAIVIALVGVQVVSASYVQRVPELNEIESVSFGSYSIMPYDSGSHTEQTLTDSNDIALLLLVHQALIDERDDAIDSSSYLRITYTLQDGSTVQRYYQLSLDEEKLRDPNSAACLLLELLNEEYILWRSYFPENLTVNAIVSAEYWQLIENRDDSTGNVYYTSGETFEFTTLEAQELYLAVVEDMQAGRLGQRRYLSEDGSVLSGRGSTITFCFYGNYQEWIDGGFNNEAQTYLCEIILYEDASATWEVLNRLMAERE